MRKVLNILIVVFLASTIFNLLYSFAEERITLTTYYPAPYGVYRELRADQMAIGSGYRSATLSDGLLLVNSSVGIGTTAPNSKLEIDSLGGIESNETDGVRLHRFTYSSPTNDYAQINKAFGDVRFISRDITNAGSFRFQGYDGATYQDYLYIKRGGNVGIGTTDPTEKLELAGGEVAITTAGLQGNNFTDRGYDPERPQTGLQLIYGSDTGGLLLQSRSNPSAGNDWDTILYWGNDGDDNLRFSYAGWDGTKEILSEKMRITSGGNVGINTTSPLARLDVRGGYANTCLKIPYAANSGTTNCPENYVIALGQAADYFYSVNGVGTNPIPVSGYFVCCLACTDNNPPDGLCDGGP